MRALIVPEKGKITLGESPEPAIGPYQALVKVEVCGICSSTDWKIINGQMTWAGPFPLVLGHESVGTVVAVGKRARRFRVGDRVTRVVLPKTDQLNSAMGGFAQFGVVTDAGAMAADGDPSLLEDYNAQRQIVVPPALDPIDAALAISLAETASVISGLPNLRQRRIVVAGTGIAGLALTLWAKLAGAYVVTLGRRQERLQRAREVGADAVVDTTAGDWVDQVQRALGADGRADGLIEAIGDVAFAEQLIGLLKPDGFATAYGAPPDGASFGARWTQADVREQATYAWVADLMLRRWIKREWFVTHTWPLDEAVGAFEQVRRGEVLKGFVRVDPS
ncbi:MAG TPA: zinc-binding dehydrogenase [Tepidisphaeraceae bacterium]|jgi:threonine dehydrogenase-like Zn-dependent dehydrogenase|nr:zinc-binding dehydrogenase [Tepidisphaeraceae bacterium]